MKANVIRGYDKNRVMLGEVIPLATPFTVFINPSTLCNFKCYYCTHGKSRQELDEMGFEQKNMSFELFLEIAEQLKAFPDKFKLIYLYGNGEPLCNPKLPEMVEHLSRMDVSEKIELFSNGALLTAERSRALVDAGLTKLKISVQGVSVEKYKEVSGVHCDFDDLVSKLRYFYEHRKQCRLYIKIMDINLTDEEKKKFFDTFGDICDEIFIEHMTYTQRTMEGYEGVLQEKVDLMGNPLVLADACTFPFYIVRIGVNGELNPCFEKIFPKDVNVRKLSLFDHWNSDLLRGFRVMHAKRKRYDHPVCGECCCLSSTTLPEDRIDEYLDQILDRMGEAQDAG